VQSTRRPRRGATLALSPTDTAPRSRSHAASATSRTPP
jgi:hypothetical protein